MTEADVEAIAEALELLDDGSSFPSSEAFARAAIKALEARGWNCASAQEAQWQPIATAPKDGTKILVTDANTIGCEECVHWDDDPRPANSVGWQWATDDGPSYHVDRFTHWMPLPVAPYTTAQEADKILVPRDGDEWTREQYLAFWKAYDDEPQGSGKWNAWCAGITAMLSALNTTLRE